MAEVNRRGGVECANASSAGSYKDGLTVKVDEPSAGSVGNGDYQGLNPVGRLAPTRLPRVAHSSTRPAGGGAASRCGEVSFDLLQPPRQRDGEREEGSV